MKDNDNVAEEAFCDWLSNLRDEDEVAEKLTYGAVETYMMLAFEAGWNAAKNPDYS